MACKNLGAELDYAMRHPPDQLSFAKVLLESRETYEAMYPDGRSAFITQAFGWARECFSGQYRDYQAVDALYHDFTHTLQGASCMTHLLRGRWRAGAEPRISQETFELGVLAILLHDSGYLKKRDDTEGTGAKYTLTHVQRSSEFAGRLLKEKGFSDRQIAAAQNMIHCTGVNAAIAAIPFQSEEERVTGFALATADLLGQMAADDYIEKLPILYQEFEEAVRFCRDPRQFIASFKSPADLMERTPGFWENFVRPKLDGDFMGIYKFLSDPYPVGPNRYIEAVQRNIAKLRSRLADAVTA